jgi:hypothetical protein
MGSSKYIYILAFNCISLLYHFFKLIFKISSQILLLCHFVMFIFKSFLLAEHCPTQLLVNIMEIVTPTYIIV